MKKLLFLSLCLLAVTDAAARRRKSDAERADSLRNVVAWLAHRVDSLTTALETLEKQTVPVHKPVDASWEKWQDVRYNYGFNPAEQPVFNTVDGVLESTVMLSVRGGRGRWNSRSAKPKTRFADGGHVFEGWNATETCRLTMLIGKQAPDIACIQVYSPKGLYRTQRHFGWVKLGSDDRLEGVDFGRRWAKAFVPFTLDTRSAPPTDTMYLNEQLGSTDVPVGTLYYDTAADRVRCFTADGWRWLAFE